MFSIGEKVTFLSETGNGIIINVDNSNYLVRDENGFERSLNENELVKIHSFDFEISIDKVSKSNDLEDVNSNNKSKSIKKEKLTSSNKSNDCWEIDLHIEEIIESHIGLSNFQILTKQINEFKTFYNKARAQRIRKIMIIHGVGEGVLKQEIRAFLSKQEAIEFYDADFRIYGKGATAVEIYYNYK